MSDEPEDTELFERLRAHDPAASLPPADPAQVARLLEEAVSHDLDSPTRRRTPLTWLVAAAALLVLAGVGVFAVAGGDDEPQVPTAQDPAPTVVELSARPPVAAKCAVPTAEILSLQETAFDGTVSAIADGTVTLDVTEWYRGGPADQVTVDAPPTDMQALLQAADFKSGQRYLVSANDGFVTVCGFTAPYSDDLAALYVEAFGAPEGPSLAG
jgi:hypothetical protein